MMLYYRFRSPTETGFKELLYDELFFASPAECNDPFDSKSFYEFAPDVERWTQLLKFALSKLHEQYPQVIHAVASEISRKCPLTFDEASSTDFTSLFLQTTTQIGPLFAVMATRDVQRIFQLYKPMTSYFVSFSRINNEPLMRSHYAMRHEGFCLVFRSHDGTLQQNRLFSKTAARRITRGGIAPSMSQGIPERFCFQDISYAPIVNHLCAFQLFPEAVAGAIHSEEERIQVARQQETQNLQKSPAWNYEAETRLTLSPPIPWLFGDRFEYSVQERLFHFESTQLVGIIFGARMSEEHKNRVYAILDEREERVARQVNYKRVMFDFFVQQARLSSRHRGIEICPVRFHRRSGSIEPGDEKFERMYQQWREGWGLELDGNRGSVVQVRD